MAIKKGNIGNALHSVAPDHIVTTADEVFDETQNKYQNEINSGIGEDISDIESDISSIEANIGYYECNTGASTAAKIISVSGYSLVVGGAIKVKFINTNTASSSVTLNINGVGAKPLYYNGNLVDANNTWEAGEVVDIYYDGTNYQANSVDGGFGDGVYDISVEHLTEGNPTQYESLIDALGTNGANIPTNKRKGGMSIKYIDSTIGKYVQYRYTGTSTTNADISNTDNWQGVDSEPIVGSHNLVESGGVFPTINAVNKSLIPINGKVSIIGDSISTFNGTMPSGYVTYYPQQSLGVISLYDMWWHLLLSITNSELEVNASWSGSRATNGRAGEGLPDFYDRTNILGSPDYIFVELGTNDSSSYVTLGDYDYDSEDLSESEFIPAYIKGIKALKTNYPNAKIILFIFQMRDSYANAIRNIGKYYELDVIDVRSYYINNVHPNKLQMCSVSQIVSSFFIKGKVDDEPIAGSINPVESGGVAQILGRNKLLLNWINHRNINPADGELVSHTDTIASNTLLSLHDSSSFSILYVGNTGNTIKYNAAFFNENGEFISRMPSYVNNDIYTDAPTAAKYVRLCLALYDGNTNIGGEQDNYDLGNCLFDISDSINYRVSKLQTDANELQTDVNELQTDVNELQTAQKNLLHTVVLQGNNEITVIEPMVYGQDVTIRFSKTTERAFVVKLNGMTGADINIIPSSAELVIPHNKNLWINYITRQLVVSDDMSMENAIFMGRNYIGRLVGGVFSEILANVNKASINKLEGYIGTLSSLSFIEAMTIGFTAANYVFINNRGFSPSNGTLISSTSIACEEYLELDNSSEKIYFEYHDDNHNVLNISVAWYDSSKTFIQRDNWHRISALDYNTKPANALYFRLAFGLFSPQEENIGNDVANYTLSNLKILPSSCQAIQIKDIDVRVTQNAEDIEIIKGIIPIQNIEYDGQPIVIRPKLGFELLAQSTHAAALQGGAAFGDYYFQFHGQNNKNGQGVANLFYGVEIFNLTTKTKVQEILLGFDCLKHNNSASFSNQYYDVQDSFPLLYVSQEDAQARYVTVYRVQGTEGTFTLTMIQVIYLPPTSEGADYYYPNCFVDLISNKIVFSGFSNTDNTKYTFEEWELPLPSVGSTIAIGRVTMTDGGDGTPTEVDGFTLPNGNVVRRNDNDSTTEIKAVLLQENNALKTFYISKVNPYTNMNATTQGGCMFDGKVYQSFGSANNSVLKVIDVKNEKVVSTVDLTKIENYEPEAVFVFDDKIGFACNASGRIKCLLT